MTYGVYPQKKGGSGPTGPTIIDCKYLVGNVPNGDSAVPYAADGFFYFPDPGDGSGIDAALTAAANVPGDVHIRPGTYDFGQGAVVMPLTVPEGVIVSGAGNPVTTLIARSSGDQGVFKLSAGGSGQSNAIVRDMRISAADAGNAGGGSSALISLRGSGAKVIDVGIEFTANALSPLRHAIYVSTARGLPIPLCEIQNVIASCGSSLLPNGTPTVGILIEEGQVHASNVQMVGFDYGYHVKYNGGAGGALLFGDTLYAVEYAQYGFHVTQAAEVANVCALRVHNGVAFARSSSPPPLGAGTNAGFQINAGLANTIASCVMVGAYYGVNVTPDSGTTTNVQVDDCTIALTSVGVQFNEGTSDSSVSGCDIGDEFNGVPVPITTNIGVFVNAYGRIGAKNIVVDGNSIKVTNYDQDLNSSCGVILSGVNQAFVSDNSIVQANGPTYPAIYCEQTTDSSIANNAVETSGNFGGIYLDSDCDRVSVSGNQVMCVNVNTLYGIYVRCPRATVTGNVIDHSLSTSLTATLWVRDNQCTVTGNTIRPSPTGTAPAIQIDGSQNTCCNNVCSLDNPPGTAAISLLNTSSNNVVIGNVCLTTPAVQDVGTSNEVAHNI